MRKAKISFSLLVMAIISMMSVVVFAATTAVAPTKAVVGIKAEALSTTRAALFFGKDPAEVVLDPKVNTSYDHYTVKVLTDATPVERTVVNGGVISFENALLTGTKTINIEIKAYGDSGTTLGGPVATYSFDVDADELTNERHNYDGTHDAIDKDSATLQDNNLRNANNTGLGQLNKAVSGHAVHGDYKNNTNSCASCHQTHTAAASRLLFKKSDYAACVTCHNGTLGYFNVFETDNSKDLGGGTFGGTHAAGNMSVHMVDGSVLIGAAPGANVDIAKGAWTSEFSCTSCHDPHGSYSKRLLASDPNGMAFVDRTVTDGISYGNKINDLPIVDLSGFATTAARTTEITSWAAGDYKTALGAVKAAKFTLTSSDVTTGSSYYGLKQGDKIIQIYRWNDSLETPAWVPAPFMASGANSGDKIDLATGLESTVTNDFNGVSFNNTKYGAWKAKESNSKAAALPGWFINQTKGFVKLGQSYVPASVTTALTTGLKSAWQADGTINPALVVDKNVDTVFTTVTYVTNLSIMQVTDLPQVDTGLDTASGTPIYKTDLTSLVGKNVANGYNQFCATCHVDYLGANKYNAATATTPESGVGTGTNKFFHHAMSSNYTCARCHFAHGTDATWMKDAAGRDVNDLQNITNPDTSANYTKSEATAYLKDQNNSSALKRYTNMSVCYGCHTSSHSEVIVNSGTFGNSTDQVNGLNVDGSASLLYNNYDVTKTVGVQ